MMRARAVVIGGGAVGASCFYHLIQRGLRDVLLVEQAGLAAGSSGRSAAVVETQYLAPEKIALCGRSMALFRRFERDHGLPFVHHGYLRLGHSAEDLERFQRSVEIQREYGVSDARVLDRAEVRHQVPDLHVEDLAGALFGPSDGYIDPVRLCELFVQLGKEGGGQAWLGRRVTDIRVRSGRVAGVVCGAEEIACETVVNAAGAWARPVGRLAGVELPVDGYRRQIVIFEPPEPFARPVPMIVDYVPVIEREGLYFRDDTPRRLIAGLHWEGHGDWERPEVADAFRLDADWDYAARVAELLSARYPPASRFTAQGGWAGLYPLTPDSEPIIGEIPGLPGLYNAIGAGGVGVQTSPAIGAVVADLVTSGRTSVVPSLEGYRLERFRPTPSRPATTG
jgi:glycine/D-amino acid oxidase-like deaminating enzyme